MTLKKMVFRQRYGKAIMEHLQLFRLELSIINIIFDKNKVRRGVAGQRPRYTKVAPVLRFILSVIFLCFLFS